MSEWTFMDYLEARGDNPIHDWLSDRRQVPMKAKARIDRILLQLAGTASWTRPLTSNLDGYPGIIEIRIRWMNTQYRLLGCRGPGHRQFTLLFPATEQGDRFVPSRAPEIATNRMATVLNDRSRVREHRFR